MIEAASRVPSTLLPAARAMFAGQLPAAVAYAELLAAAGVQQGLIGPREVPRLWERHLLNSAAIAPLVPPDSRVVDVGSGAGLPGIPLALARSDLAVTLLEPMLRRVEFLNQCVQTLGLTHVHVLRARAGSSDLPPPPSQRWDVVTARAVAPLANLAEWTLPLLAPGGVLLAIKGRTAAAEVQAAEPTLRRLGARSWRCLELGWSSLGVPTTVVAVVGGETAPRQQRGGRLR